MFDLITIGNISIDIFFQGDSLTFKDDRFQLALGGKYFVDRVIESVGGGGANVAIGASKNGLKTAVLGKIGNNPFKKIVLEKLRAFDVSTKLCQFKNDYSNISTILLSKKGERTIIHYSSPHQKIIENKQDWHKLKETRAVYLGNLPDVSLTEKLEVLSFLRKNKILTIVNLGVNDCRRPKDQLKKMLDHVDVLIVNNHEFAEIVKAPVGDIRFSDDVIDWYVPYLRDNIVVVTAGKLGSYLYYLGKNHHEKPAQIDRIADTTGAGDAYCAGFISEYLRSKDLIQSMKNGSKYACKILAKVGSN